MLDRDAIYAVLRTVLDPEMPVNIVDLGIVADVRLESGHGIAHGAAYVSVDVTPTFVGCPALEMLAREIRDRLNELPDVLETRVNFVNSPPWSVDCISPAGRAALQAHGVVVPDGPGAGSGAGARLTPLTVSAAAAQADDAPVRCPFCNSSATELESRFGPTRCRMIYYCTACRNSFERLKPI